MVIAIGSRVSRDIVVPGRENAGIHLAMDYLYQRNRWVAKHEGRPFREVEPGTEISAAGRKVIVIGGGDTGMDCISNAEREGAESATILDVYAELLESDPRHPWPLPPKRTLTTYALDEGGQRRWGTEVTGFGGSDGKVTHVYARKVTGASSRDLTPVPGSEFVVEADLALIAIGFEHPEHEGLVSELDLGLDRRGNIRTEQTYRTSHPGGLRLRRRAHRPVTGRNRDRGGAQVRACRKQGAGRRADGPGSRAAGDRRLERRGRQHAAARGRGGRHRAAGRTVFHRTGYPRGIVS